MARLKTHEVPKAKARSHLAKANEFLAAAVAARDEEQHNAALLLAIHAGLSAGDAVTVALEGVRSTDPDHLRAADLLEAVARQSEDVRERTAQLRGLLKLKKLVEYEDRRVSAREAETGTKRAERLAQWAVAQIERARI